jgi:hypothetical protein
LAPLTDVGWVIIEPASLAVFNHQNLFPFRADCTKTRMRFDKPKAVMGLMVGGF